MSFKVGQQIEIIGNSCYHGFNTGDLVEVVELREDGTPFSVHNGESGTWCVRPQDVRHIPTAATATTVRILKERPVGGKMIYAVVNADGILELEQDRDDARVIKAELGGLKAGVKIVQYAPVKEIR